MPSHPTADKTNLNGDTESPGDRRAAGVARVLRRWNDQCETTSCRLSSSRLRPVWAPPMTCIAAIVSLVALIGCQSVPASNSILPEGERVVRDQLVIHSDFHLPKRHRLLDELVARQTDITDLLNLPTSDEPINVYLFDDSNQFRSFMQRRFPRFPDRRAFFVKNDTTLSVYAYWGDRVGEDLRHEVTHGYLHSVVPNLPLWMDEGLAEYFEVSRGEQGFNSPHVYLLANQYRRGEWEPDLNRISMLENPAEMTQVDYAESWLWIHFMMTSSGETRKLLQDQLRLLRQSAKQEPIVPKLAEVVKYYNDDVIEHLRRLADEL